MPLSFHNSLFRGPTIFSDCVRKFTEASRVGQGGEVNITKSNKVCKTPVPFYVARP